jgi:hypothetical protein
MPVSGSASLRSFYQLESASARWRCIYGYLHSQALDARLASFLSEESLFASQHFDAGALLRSPEHTQTVQTLFEMTRGVQFSDQTDEITEANHNNNSGGGGGGSNSNSSSSNKGGGGYQNRTGAGRDGEMLHIPIPHGLRAGDRLVHTMPDGERIELRVPKGKKGGDTILCLCVRACLRACVCLRVLAIPACDVVDALPFLRGSVTRDFDVMTM